MSKCLLGLRTHAAAPLAAGVVLLFCAGTSASASTTFSFSNLGSYGGTYNTWNTLPAGDNSAAVQASMNAQFAGANTVTSVSGAYANFGDNYSGDGYVVGPANGTGGYKALTLGKASLSGGILSYSNTARGELTTDPNAADAGAITMTFAQAISSVSFSFEIFPDATEVPGNQATAADFEFWTGTGGTATTNLFTILATAPGTAPVLTAAEIAAGMTINTTYTHSTQSGSSVERVQQLIGYSGLWNLAPGTNTISFRDWPPMVGIADLTISTVPLPGAAWLFGAALGLLSLRRRAAD